MSNKLKGSIIFSIPFIVIALTLDNLVSWYAALLFMAFIIFIFAGSFCISKGIELMSED